MKIDNFRQIQAYLEEDDLVYLYEVQVLRRGKDHPELPAANWCVKSIYIKGKDDLIKHQEEIIKLCETFQARAYISMNRKSNRKCLENAIKCYAERLYDGDFKKPEAIWSHAVGTTKPENKWWLIDVDSKDVDLLQKITDYIPQQAPNKPIIGIIPTMVGFHVLCYPFNCRQFDAQFKDAEIKKHGLTLLYA
jgi:hypothetical protein